MKTRRTLRSVLSALLCMTMLLAWLPVFPAAAAEDNVLIREDFESYTEGTDSFYEANTDDFTYYSSYHGSTTDASYATYGIVKEQGDQILRLTAHNEKANWFVTKEKAVGPYTLTMDVRVHTAAVDNATPSFIVNPFQDNTFGSGKTGLIYFDPRYGVRFTEAITTGSNVNNYMKDGDGATFKPEYDKWYTMKIVTEAGKMTVSVWDRGGSEQNANVLVWESSLLTADVLAKGSKIRLQNMARKVAEVDTIVDLDNLVLAAGASSGSSTPSGGSTSGATGGESTGTTTGTTGATISSDLGKNSWVLLNDNFESYTLGEDAFYDANKTAYAYMSGYHGSASDASYATYGIVTTDGGKALKLSAHNAKANWLLTNTGVSGAYSIRFDVNMVSPEGAKTPSLCFNVFQGNTFGSGKVGLFYIDPLYGARFTDAITTGSNVNIYMKDADGATFKPEYDKWYTMKVDVEVGKVTFKMWAKGDSEAQANVLVWESALLTADVLEKPSTLRFTNLARSETGIATSALIDNLVISKPYDTMAAPAVVYGVPGETLTAAVSYTGQDLARQEPAPVYKYTLGNTNLGYVDNGQLLLGPDQGETTLTMELTDVMGNPSGAKVTAKLVVGTSYGITPSEKQLKVAESAIGTTKSITLTYDQAVKSQYPSATAAWASADESVAKVDQTGTVTFTGFGSTTITVKVQNAGKDTEYFANIAVQVGETPVRVLFIGNSFSRDTAMYLSHLARVTGYRIEAAYLQKSSGTLRHHARNLAQNKAEYSYWKSNALSGEMVWQRTTTIQDALGDGEWDVISLQQNSLQAGMTHSYNSDLEYLIDYVKAEQPKAKLFWNLTWSYENGLTTGTHGSNFVTYYDGNEVTMFNAIVRAFNEKIWGANAKYNEFDGWIPTGVVVQNLRETYGPVTRDGFHLSLSVGRMAAAMAALKAIIPEADLSKITAASVASFIDLDQYDEGIKDDDTLKYSNTEANMTLVRNAVKAATADLTRGPALRTQPKAVRVEDETKQDDITVAQVYAPMKLHFPDITVLKDGTAIVAAYENFYHYPNNTTTDDNYAIEGAGRLVVWASRDNGKTWDYDNPLLVVDEENLEKWGIAQTSNRYERLKDNPSADYLVLADPRDPNFGLVYTDITGDGVEDEVLLFTFWMRNYKESAFQYSTHMMWSIDGGKTWSNPQSLEYKTISVGLKRGDIAAFADGEILVPVYLSNRAYALRMKWNMGTKKWVLVAETEVPNTRSDESKTFNEVSFVVPDPDSDTVYVFCREPGNVLRSDDRGATWTEVGNEPGLIHQPGFAIVDKDRVFATWARTASPRTVYGKMFYINGGWDATPTQTVYASPVTKGHDMGDPSSKLLANGKILAVCYDTAYRSIVGTWIDPNSSENTVAELSSNSGEVVLSEQTFSDGKTGTISFNTSDLPDSYTVYTEAAFSAGGQVTVNVPKSSAIVFKAGEAGIEAGKTYCIRVAVVGTSAFTRVWVKGEQEPADWTAVKGTSANTALTVVANNAKVTVARISQRVTISLQETLVGKAKDPDVKLDCQIMPAMSGAVWTSSDPTVVTVDQTGTVAFLRSGTATVTVNINGAVASCQVTVESQPAELSGEGERKVIFVDDFQSYTAGTNAFWSQMEAKGYVSNGTAAVEGKSTYDIVTENGNTYLKLGSSGAKATWHKVNTPIVGDYTVQFDFNFTHAGPGKDKNSAPGQYLYITLFQDSGVHGFVHLAPEGIRTQYIPEGETGTVNYPEYFGNGDIQYELNQWHTIKISRVDGGLYVKVWKQGEAEPEQWDLMLADSALKTTPQAYFRMQFYMSGSDTMQYVGVDNLTVSQQQGKGAAFMNDVKAADWYFNAVDYALKNGIMGGYNATTFGPDDSLTRAMLVQMLYNREGTPAVTGSGKFTDVTAADWYSKAVTWAAEKGVVSGYGTLYKPNQNITRQELCQMLYNYAGKPAVSGDLAKFPDANKVDGWATNALIWATQKGVMGGKGGGYLDPLGKATRAEAATMLMNYIEKVVKG